jgi:aspartate aminotransferase
VSIGDFSPNVEQLEPSSTLALAARARALKADGVPVVDLSAGEPQYPSPAFAMEAATSAIEAGKTGYPPTPGLPELRQAIAGYLTETTATTAVDSTEVIVSAGVKQALFNCCYALFGEGDEVLIPAPYWVSYPALVGLAGAKSVFVDTAWDDGLLVSTEQLEAARSSRTRGLLLNSPSNPSGAVYNLQHLTEILAWAAEHDIWVLSDEIYRRLAYENAAPSVFDVPDRGDQVVLFDGVSKAFCMPGFRIGYAVGPAQLIQKTTDLQGQTTSGAAGPSQYAAAAALGQSEAREAFVGDLVNQLRVLRDLGITTLKTIDTIEVQPAPGALYFYVKLLDDSRSSMEVAEDLLLNGLVASVPGEPFGSPGHLRFNFAVEQSVLEEGLERIKSFFG